MQKKSFHVMTQNQNKIILVPSCDKYADLWNPFFAFRDKFWPDPTWKVYLTVNLADFSHHGVEVIKTGTASDWSSELRKALELIPSDYFLLILEDYFIYEPVDSKEIERLFEIACKDKIDFLRLGCFPGRYNTYWPYDALKQYPGLAEIRNGAKYRINLQTAIWYKPTLMALLKDGENPWEFEIKGSERANSMNFRSYCVIEDAKKEGIHGPITYIGGAITKGKWMLDALRLAKKNNITIDTSKRPVETKKEEVLRKFYVSTPLFIRPAYRYMTNKLGVKW